MHSRENGALAHLACKASLDQDLVGWVSGAKPHTLNLKEVGLA